MSNDLNQCQFIGRLGRDPEVTYTSAGKPVAKLSIAVGKSWKDDGQKKESTTWVPMVAFGRLAEVCGQYLHKGDQAFVSGEFSSRQWETKDGQKRTSTEIVIGHLQMLGNGTGKATGGNREPQSTGQGQRQDEPDTWNHPASDEQIPF